MICTGRFSRNIFFTWPGRSRRNCRARRRCSKPSARRGGRRCSGARSMSRSKRGLSQRPPMPLRATADRRFWRTIWQLPSHDKPAASLHMASLRLRVFALRFSMEPPDPPPKLRMAPPETAEELARSCQREQRAANVQRESNLFQSLAPFRAGSVRYLNAVPLTRGLEEEIIFATPAKLAAMLQRGELDAALVSVTEVLFKDHYDVLDGIAVASLGEVKSVLLAHKKPLEEAKEIFCDTASLTSVQLLRVLLADRGLEPEFKPLPNYNFSELPDFA